MGGWVSTEIDPFMIFRSFAQFVDFQFLFSPLLQTRVFFSGSGVERVAYYGRVE